MYEKLVASLDKVANTLQEKGFTKEAEEIDVLSNTLERQAAAAMVVLRFPNQFADEVLKGLEAAAAGRMLQGDVKVKLGVVLEKFLREPLRAAMAEQPGAKQPTPEAPAGPAAPGAPAGI